MKRPWHRQTSGMGRSRQSQADNLDRFCRTSDDGFEPKAPSAAGCSNGCVENFVGYWAAPHLIVQQSRSSALPLQQSSIKKLIRAPIVLKLMR